jgi:hypothetical protein
VEHAAEAAEAAETGATVAVTGAEADAEEEGAVAAPLLGALALRAFFLGGSEVSMVTSAGGDCGSGVGVVAEVVAEVVVALLLRFLDIAGSLFDGWMHSRRRDGRRTRRLRGKSRTVVVAAGVCAGPLCNFTVRRRGLSLSTTNFASDRHLTTQDS